jgi:3-methylfumaryl-CoA hydratase
MAVDVKSYLGRTEHAADCADPARMDRLSALLDHDTPPWREGILPPFGHWLCFQPDARQSAIGADGHPRRSETSLLPAGNLPRRMWAGSRLSFLSDIPLGAAIERISTLSALTPKTGRSGSMLFATVRHEIRCAGALAIVEDQDIVYREAQPGGMMVERQAPEAGPLGPAVRHLAADPVMLMRYSALTFNAHRIHYDRDYARDEEGYPGLVVHGPFIATLMLDHLLRAYPAARVRAFEFRGVSPLYDGEPFTLEYADGDTGFRLRAIGPAGVAMAGAAGIEP